MDRIRRPRLEEESEIDLWALFRLFRRKIGGILLAFVMGGVLSGLLTYCFVPPKYEATAALYIVSVAGDSAANLVDLQVGTLLTTDYKELMLSRPMLEGVIKNVPLTVEDVEELKEMITISNPVGTRILSITAVSEYPEQAQKVANELARLAIEQLSEIVASSPPRLAEEAVIPTEKAGPSYLLSTLLGALALSAAYCGVEAVRFVDRDAIYSGEEFERCFGIAPLARVPDGSILDRGDPAYRKKRRGAREV